MTSNRNLFKGILLIILLSIVFVGCSSEEPPRNGDYEEAVALIENKCTTCHTASRIYATKSKEQWPQIVERMISKSPGLLEEHETNQVIEYLTENYSK